MTQEALFYAFSLRRHVADYRRAHAIDRFVDLSDTPAHLRLLYSEMERPSIDLEAARWRPPP